VVRFGRAVLCLSLLRTANSLCEEFALLALFSHFPPLTVHCFIFGLLLLPTLGRPRATSRHSIGCHSVRQATRQLAAGPTTSTGERPIGTEVAPALSVAQAPAAGGLRLRWLGALFGLSKWERAKRAACRLHFQS